MIKFIVALLLISTGAMAEEPLPDGMHVLSCTRYSCLVDQYGQARHILMPGDRLCWAPGESMAHACRLDDLNILCVDNSCFNLPLANAPGPPSFWWTNPAGCPYSLCKTVDANAGWHLLTITYGGTVSLIKGLTKDECETVKKRVWLNQVSRYEDNRWWPSSGDIKTAECFE